MYLQMVNIVLSVFKKKKKYWLEKYKTNISDRQWRQHFPSGRPELKPVFSHGTWTHREKCPRPFGALTSPASVSAHGWRSVEAPPKLRSLRPPPPPPPAICQPASATDSQPLTVLLLPPPLLLLLPLLRGVPSSPTEPRRRFSRSARISTRAG